MAGCHSTSVPELSLDSGIKGLRAWRQRLGSVQPQASQVTCQTSPVEWGIGLECSVRMGPSSCNSLCGIFGKTAGA